MDDRRDVKILVVDDEEGVRFMLTQLLTKEGYVVKEANDGDIAVEMNRHEEFDVIILDLKMPRMSGLEALKQIRQLHPNTPVLMITAHGSSPIAKQAIEAGAYDYFSKPLDNMELRIVIRRALERRSFQSRVDLLAQREQLLEKQMEVVQTERDLLEARLKGTNQFCGIIGSNQGMLEVYNLVQRVAPQDVTVLILGESGTGKELVAQAIVTCSPRRLMPFIKVNCAAIPETLLESELFGHERGAFTGAVVTKPGKFELADKGTIFLDEIGDLSASLQAKLLRILQQREFERVGGTKTIKTDIRIVAATNANLLRKVADGSFREDLYFRLNVIPIEVPPLRKRLDDLPRLVQHFVATYCRQFGKQPLEVPPEVMEVFLNHGWPGNVRELENVIQRACILSQGSSTAMNTLPPEIRKTPPPAPVDTIPTAVPDPNIDRVLVLPEWFNDFSVPLSKKIDDLILQAEKKLILRALAQTDNRRQAAADLLRISRKGLHNKMVKYGMMDETADV